MKKFVKAAIIWLCSKEGLLLSTALCYDNAQLSIHTVSKSLTATRKGLTGGVLIPGYPFTGAGST